jgi:hypothetical protein
MTLYTTTNATRQFMENNKLCFARIGDEVSPFINYFLPFEETQIYRSDPWWRNEFNLVYRSSVSREIKWKKQWMGDVLLFLPTVTRYDTDDVILAKMISRLVEFKNITKRPIYNETFEKLKLAITNKTMERKNASEEWWVDTKQDLKNEFEFISTLDTSVNVEGPTVQLRRSVELAERIKIENIVFCIFCNLHKESKIEKIRPWGKHEINFIRHITLI